MRASSGLFGIRFERRALAFELHPGVGLDGLLIEVIITISFVDHTHFDQECEVVEHIPDGEVQLLGNVRAGRLAAHQHADDPQTIRGCQCLYK